MLFAARFLSGLGITMATKQEEFMKKLLAAYKIEADEHLKAMSAGLLELEKSQTSEELRVTIETIFREAHSLKGASRAVEMRDVEAICRSLENVFSAWKRETLNPSVEQFDTFFEALDVANELLTSPEKGRAAVDDLVDRIDRLAEGAHVKESSPKDNLLVLREGVSCYPPEDEKPVPKTMEEEKTAGYAPEIMEEEEPVPGTVEDKSLLTQAPKDEEPVSRDSIILEKQLALPKTVRVQTAKLDSLLLQAEEMLATKLAASRRAWDIRYSLSMLVQWKKEWTKVYPEVRITKQLLDRNEMLQAGGQDFSRLDRLVEFLEWNLMQINSLEEKLSSLSTSTEYNRRSLGTMVDDLLEDMKKALMLPFSSLLEIFPKLVRDLSRDQGKRVKLVIKGGEIEVDRRIMEELKDPLIHLVRNCIDHGIEKPETRAQHNKPSIGTLTIAISQVEGNQIQILVTDDGAGIDLSKIKKSAVKNGVISEKEVNRLSKQEALSLIFVSGVSTSPIVTDISGRGLGMAIIREKTEKLGGRVVMDTTPGTGTSFKAFLPITLATFRGVLVKVTDQLFVVPVTNVNQSVRIKPDEIKTVQNRETISLNGRTLPLVRLGDILELPKKEVAGDLGYISILVLDFAKKSVAFEVDKIVDEREILVKGLGKQLSRVKNIGGATILGSGLVVPILNVSDLMKSVEKAAVAFVRADVGVEEVELQRKSVLVAEDSITSRMLLKNILEASGYLVKTAVDGQEAYTTLKTEAFDLVVSDVEMPRMDGFELTAKIRSDKKLEETPVVLVTSLDSREDREKGIDVGANAYIVKSSFDQSNLLEVIGRLI